MLFSIHVIIFFFISISVVDFYFHVIVAEKLLEIISMLINLLRLFLCVFICGLSWRMFYVHLRRMCILVFWGCNVLKISIKSNSSIVSFRISLALLIFSLEGLFIDVSGVIMSPTIIVFLLISPFMSVSICFMYLGAPILGAYMLMSVISFSSIYPFIII